MNKQSIQQTPSTIINPLGPPKYPNYLKQALYEKLVLTQYNFHLHKQQLKPIPISLPSKASALENDQIQDLDLRLPTLWNPKDKSKNIEVGSNGLDLSYIGPGIQETHAALVRSNFPMRPQCGIFYYEMKVLSKGDDGFIGIGFCCSSNKLERLPGWDTDSWGYHGDDGHSFAGSGTGKDYGPRFSTGDIIGCGVNFADRSAFYTKNGRHLGTAFKNMELKKPIYPAIGLRTPRERVTTNFGHDSFVFDIEQYVKDQKREFIKQIIQNVNTRSNQLQQNYSKETMDQLILSYLIHHGYTGTAKAVVQNTGHASSQEILTSNDIDNMSEKDMEERQLIRNAIIKGKIEEAIQLINAYFPGVLQEGGRGQELELRLKCGHFIEMVRDYYECNKKSRVKVENGHHKLRTNGKSKSILKPPETFCTTTTTTVPNQRRRLSYAAIANSLLPSKESQRSNKSDMMEVDNDHKQSLHGNIWKKRTSVTSSHENNNIKDELNDRLNYIVKYGQKLREEYRHDVQEKTESSLAEISALLAYPDLDTSPVAYLMDISRRDALATEVNAAILAFQNRPEMPALERVYRQVILCNKELVCEGNGKAALINIEGYCSNNMEL